MNEFGIRNQILLGAFLLSFSTAGYFFHFWIFKDAHTLFFYLIFDIAFVPIQVLLVTVIIDRLLQSREKAALLNKMNMAIGIFYNEMGVDLFDYLSGFGTFMPQVGSALQRQTDWSGKHYKQMLQTIKGMEFAVDCKKGNLTKLRIYMIGKREFLLRLLQNANLLEHERFTDLLWAVFHLEDELAHRNQVRKLSAADCAHLSGDIQRVLTLLVMEWLVYMQHLRGNYPYLFSLALRTNPFDPKAKVEAVG